MCYPYKIIIYPDTLARGLLGCSHEVVEWRPKGVSGVVSPHIVKVYTCSRSLPQVHCQHQNAQGIESRIVSDVSTIHPY